MVDEVYLLVRHATKRGAGVKESKRQMPLLSWIHEVAMLGRRGTLRGSR